jgi:hypothetical protein
MGVFLEKIKSPNLKPTIFSFILSLIKSFPLYTEKVRPTEEGNIKRFFIFLKYSNLFGTTSPLLELSFK